MPRIAKALSDTEVRAAKPRDKSHKLADGGGMYLLVQPTGGKLWRMDYAFAGRRKTLALGAYPDVSLKDARKRREDAREMLANGIDPGEAKRARKAAVYGRAANSFEAVAREWFHVWKQDKAETHHTKVISRLEHDVFPFLGGRPIREIDAPEILGVLRRIASRGTLDTAHRAGGNCSQVFRYAVATGKASRNPVPDLKGALPSVTKEHYPAITDRAKVGELLRAIGAYNGNPNVVAALNLLPLLFVRPGELRKMRWAELDLEKAEWKYFVTKTKT
ncbi:MAG: integrase arm-type DNA-binding domain-containing protein, partial [Candidatus Accumulibacter sp.]|nr:integrase arm-type DNA-binding domain-containing protein [Accumulibacter sp.]